MCLREREYEVWCHRLYPPVGLNTAQKRASHPSLLKSQTDHVSLTTRGHGQFSASYDKAVVSPDIREGSLTSGCDGSKLKDRRGAGLRLVGEGCRADMSHAY